MARARVKKHSVDGMRKTFDRQINEFHGAGLDINFNHTINPGLSEWASFGMYWIASLGNTGHHHIVVLPTFGATPDAWPVAHYDEHEGVATTFATSLRTWFPSYLIHLTHDAFHREDFAAHAGELVAHCKKYFKVDAKALVEGRAAGTLTAAQAYALVEPGTLLHRYWQLAEANDARGMKKLAHEHRAFNAPLYWLLTHKHADERDSWEVFRRTFRFDMGDTADDVHKLAARKAVEKSAGTALEPYVKRVRTGRGARNGAAAYVAYGEQLAKKRDHLGAFAAYENAYYLQRLETEAIHEVAYARLVELAETIGDDSYSSYVADCSAA